VGEERGSAGIRRDRRAMMHHRAEASQPTGAGMATGVELSREGRGTAAAGREHSATSGEEKRQRWSSA
jgi:hypothetical protein